MYTVADSLKTLRSYAPPAIVPADRLAEIDRLASQFPAELCECFGFEVRLGDDGARTDFALQITTMTGRRVLAEAGRSPEFARRDVSARSWECIRAFASEWSDPRHPLFSAVTDVWLEFDLDRDSPRHGVPAVFLGLARGIDADEQLAPALEAVSLLADAGVSDLGRAAILACSDALEGDARISQLGTMLSRDCAPVRVCIADVPADRLADYLLGVASPREAELAAYMLDAAPLEGSKLTVDLDVADRIMPRIGIELSLPQSRELDGLPEERWGAFLDRLVAGGLCTSARSRGVLAWAGCSREQFLHRAQSTLVFRGLSHVKLEGDRSDRLSAKAYVGFLPDRLTLLFADDDLGLEPASVPVTVGSVRP